MVTPSPHVAELPVNHHSHHSGFHGLYGWYRSVAFLFHRTEISTLAVDLAEVYPGTQAIDVGCGPGVAVRVARQRGACVVGVDPSWQMLRVAAATSLGVDHVAWHQATAETLDAPAGWADVVWAVSTIHHLQHVPMALAQIRHALRPGGRLVVVEKHTGPDVDPSASHGWTLDQRDAFTKHCEAAGFSVVSADQHTDYDVPAVSVIAERLT